MLTDLDKRLPPNLRSMLHQLQVQKYSREHSPEMLLFSRRARQELEERGYATFPLLDFSLAQLEKKYSPPNYREIMVPVSLDASSHPGTVEVAVHPNQVFLPKSNHSTFLQQQNLLVQASHELGILGVEMRMAEAAHLVQLALLFYDRFNITIC